MLKLAVLTTHPIQYQAPLYRALAARPDVALKVFFCWDFGVRDARDPGFGRTIRWDVPLLDGYEHTFLPNISTRPGTDHFFGIVNPAAGREIAAFQPDAVVVHGYTHATELAVIAACRARGIPVLLRGESNLLPRRSTWVRAIKRIGLPAVLHNIAGALAIGTLSSRYFAHYGVPEDRTFLAPYTVDNAFFQRLADGARAEARAWRRELDLGEDERVVLFAAKLIDVKAPLDLLRAFAAISPRGAALVFVGDGKLKSELSAAAASFSHVNVRFTGFVNQTRMPAAYALGDLFVLPSRFEPWGLAVNEAMNLGLPIIVSDQVSAAPDLVSARNGWVFPAGDVDALSRVLRAALDDPEGLKRRGQASLERIAEWDIPHTADGFLRGARAVSRSSPG